MARAKSKPRCAPSEPKDLDYPQKFLLRVVAHLVSQTHFLSSLSKSRDEISFKGGSLSHPKFWNVKIIKKTWTMFACLDLKFHKELKLFELS
jgi:hypothetical protein